MDPYQQALARLFARRNQEKRKDLKISEKLSQIFGNPHKAFPMIHVAGTNGKGSVVTKIAAALQAAGWKTGLYTSPHLFNYEERISINGKMIPKEKILEKEKIVAAELAISKLEPNFFEITTSFALSYFWEEKVDVAVIETGLGGKLDATNIITPILTIITSISRDHTEILGNTLEEIAAEKAGIIKSEIPVVLGPRVQFRTILAKAHELSAPVYLVKKSGFYAEENCAIVRQALELLRKRFALNQEHIERGLKTSIPCRFEKRGHVIFDVAHNPDGFAALIATLKYSFPNHKIRFVTGISKDKEIPLCLAQIAQIASFVHFVQSKLIPTACPPEELGKYFVSLCSCPFSLEESVEIGLKNAIAVRKQNELIVVCGSFYIMKQAFSHFEKGYIHTP